MNNLQNKNKRSGPSRSVFRKHKKLIRKTNVRLIIEFILMMSAGIASFFLLQSIAVNYDIANLISLTIDSYQNLFVSFVKALKGSLSLILLFILGAICITLFLGSLYRLLRLANKRIPRSKNKKRI